MNAEINTQLRQQFCPDGSLLRRHQERMLELVAELDRICRQHGIPYFLYGGTLLGAIRHNGFIPWDDDLDVAMLRADYLRLLEVLPSELPPHIALQTNDTDPNYFFFFAKLRDRNSLLEELSPYDQAFQERGIYIDIFPFDQQRMWTHRLAEPLQAHTFKIFRTANNRNAAMRKIRAITRFNRAITFPTMRAISRLTCGKTLTYDYGIPFHIPYNISDIFPLETHQFEHLTLPIPHGWHNMLTTQYGNYMQLPPLQSIEHHVRRLEFIGNR